jgi:hypothetical protein
MRDARVPNPFGIAGEIGMVSGGWEDLRAEVGRIVKDRKESNE